MVALLVLAVLIAIATPRLLDMRITSNEVSARAGLKAIYSAVQLYCEEKNAYPENLSDLAGSDSSVGYIGADIASGLKDGYNYSFSLEGTQSFSARANPAVPGKTGKKYFYIDETGVIRFSAESEAGPDDPAVS